jgi:hypothetical protein
MWLVVLVALFLPAGSLLSGCGAAVVQQNAARRVVLDQQGVSVTRVQLTVAYSFTRLFAHQK